MENERTARRSFAEPRHRQRPLIVIDHTLPAFGLRIGAGDARTFFVRVKRRLGAVNVTLGTADELTAAEARTMALAEIEAVKAECATGPPFRDFADEFMRRQSRRRKPATRESNRAALASQILPFFGDMRLPDIDRAGVARWFDSLTGPPPSSPARFRCPMHLMTLKGPVIPLYKLMRRGDACVAHHGWPARPTPRATHASPLLRASGRA